MCGIAGGMGAMTRRELKSMAQSLNHRGPDNIDYKSFNGVHFAHTRLSIIDLTDESNQPLWDSTKRACIIFNGEIYNYKALRQELIGLGVVFTSQGDAEVLLNMYLYFDIEMFNKINGIFSFSIWDSFKKEMVLARDHFGVKPLYYVENDSGVYFASEIKALLKIESIKKEINYDALFRTLVFLYSPGPETILKNIQKINPGSYVRVKNNKIIQSDYFWKWPDYNPDDCSANKHAENVLTALNESVKAQLESDVTVGSFLSGGLDSSLIVALAKANKKDNIPCYTIKVNTKNGNDGFEDDLPYAIEVANHLQVDLNIIEVDTSIIQKLPDMIYHLDELQADPAPLNVMSICNYAKSNNIKVLLSGAGGDDIFSGYRRHYAIQMEKYWTWLPKIVRSTLKVATSNLSKKNPFKRRIAKAFAYADLNENERLLSYFYWIDPNIVRGLFVKDKRDSISKNPMRFMLNELNLIKHNDPLEKMLYIERSYFLVDHNLNYTDKIGMSQGVEVRVPFLDRNLVKVASRIPSKYKQSKKIGKWILKKSAEEKLPKSIIYRSKSGFGAPLREWLNGELAPMVDKYLSREKLNSRGVFDYEKVKILLNKDRSGEEDYSYPIFALLCFEIWCQKFID
jgi:asparagine synthase (glutamine-hydrolysing)